MTDELAGLTALVTGGNAGIGRATVRELLDRGAQVVTIDLKVDDVPEGARGAAADVSDPDQVRAAVEELLGGGRLDILVNNAGISFEGGIEDGSAEDWHRLWSVNVLGYVHVTRAVLPLLRKSRHASIVNVSSCTADTGVRDRALYSATKGAIKSMSLSMARDLIAEGIRVNVVLPGTVDTPFMSELAGRAEDPAGRRAEYHARQPIGRMVAPEEVAYAIAGLAGPRAASTVGTALTVDGGLGRLLL
ncbi:SDR family oxidoreductase [Streptomyces sp. NPDC047000]|uniref:SDR family NAD(P)-dependent oxidoreductase n=1 Tax=Streptomyces sp. NPDC047000 TaxID=3155474 RepID=UPI0033C7017E